MKHDITKYFVEIYLKMAQWYINDFPDYCCSSLGNENTLAIERSKHFTEAATKRHSSNLCLATIIKIIWECLWRSQIFKKIWNESCFSNISRVLISVVKQLCYKTAFLYNTSWWLLASFELIVARALQGYVFLEK